jgi:adenylate kinase family enzyme
MSRREIIIVNDMPGSGAEHLSELLADTEHSSEAISFGRLVRRIGRTGVTSLYEDDVKVHLNKGRVPEELPPELGSDIIREFIQKAELSRRLIIDGFPYDTSQISDLQQVAYETDRDMTKALHVVTHPDLAIQTLMGDYEYPLSEEQARAALSRYRATSPMIRLALLESGIMVHRRLYVESAKDTAGDRISLLMAQRQLDGAEYENSLIVA